ncbi:hypothetical protein R5R73_04920 [Salinicola sp. LHM]|uniref:hypothetical protein n=1 Tax=Salinicola sp. LHM TaxID=3065298 RepID=UPI002ACE198D|nr:hypothetical protein [Salinicola sp. LHM]WQH34032.1 hypothetical protein R5R73_04920 [Salinicola sp. LHM]
MNGFEIKIREEAFDGAREALADLEAELQFRAVRAGLNRATKPILATMGELVPVQQSKDPGKVTGQLKASLARRSLSKSARARLGLAQSTVALRVGPIRKVNGRSQEGVGQLVEFGVDPGTRTVRRNLLGRGVKWHNATYSYFHPGQKPQPFMANSLERNSSTFESLFYQGLNNYLRRKGVGQ